MCQEISPLGFTSLLLTAVYEYTRAHLLPSERGKQAKILSFLSVEKILQTPFGPPPMNFIQDWGHMGLFIAAKKRAKLTAIDFLFSSHGNQKLFIHCFWAKSNLETDFLTKECFVCLLWLPPEVLHGDCVACYAYLRIWIQIQFAQYNTRLTQN